MVPKKQKTRPALCQPLSELQRAPRPVGGGRELPFCRKRHDVTTSAAWKRHDVVRPFGKEARRLNRPGNKPLGSRSRERRGAEQHGAAEAPQPAARPQLGERLGEFALL